MIEQEKLDNLLKLKEQIQDRRDKILQHINKNKATIELYEKQLNELRQECLRLGVDPENIDSYIEKLYMDLKNIAENYSKSLKEVYSFLKERGLWDE